jgi:hypothetical protein
MKDHGVEPELRLTLVQKKELAELTEQTGHDDDELLREALHLLRDKYRRKTSGTKP